MGIGERRGQGDEVEEKGKVSREVAGFVAIYIIKKRDEPPQKSVIDIHSKEFSQFLLFFF